MDALKRFLRHHRTIRVSRILIGLVFLLAALPKIGDMASFAGQIHNFRMMPIALENLLAMVLPWVELVAGLALVLGIRARAGALVTVVLSAIFLIAIGQAVARGLDIECGCFGTADASRVGVVKLLEDAGYLVLALIG
ncbi:MAG: MauE/DoxX family redox-associated membrane protein, partial [Acidobacteriota bacterium]|nr:MauE/DoxX family redox-associated membrane protein [Acidobacteriota bacterium]